MHEPVGRLVGWQVYLRLHSRKPILELSANRTEKKPTLRCLQILNDGEARQLNSNTQCICSACTM